MVGRRLPGCTGEGSSRLWPHRRANHRTHGRRRLSDDHDLPSHPSPTLNPTSSSRPPPARCTHVLAAPHITGGGTLCFHVSFSTQLRHHRRSLRSSVRRGSGPFWTFAALRGLEDPARQLPLVVYFSQSSTASRSDHRAQQLSVARKPRPLLTSSPWCQRAFVGRGVKPRRRMECRRRVVLRLFRADAGRGTGF